jgi:imidazolonepropionase-like amidohydrolase
VSAHEEVLISADAVLTGTPGEVINDGALRLWNGEIAAVGPRAEIEETSPRDAPHQRFRGATILPGLIDTHVHLVFCGSSDAGDQLRAERDDRRLLLQMSTRAEALLRSGVTTARDLGDRSMLSLVLRDGIAAGEVAGPRLRAATTPLTAPGGHCWFLGGQVSGEADIRTQVGHIAEAGADAIKVMASGGHSTAGPYAMWDTQFSEEELGAAVEEAHGYGLPVAAHAHSADAISRAVNARVDSIEHGTWLIPGPDWDPRDEVAEQMAAQGTVFCHGGANDWRRFAGMLGEANARMFVGRTAWYERHGVTQVMGTDAGISEFTGSASALRHFGEYGFSPERIIEIGTVAGARSLGLEDITGTLRPGLAADVLVVDGDPLSDLSALERTVTVFARGERYQGAWDQQRADQTPAEQVP